MGPWDKLTGNLGLPALVVQEGTYYVREFGWCALI